MFNPRMIKQHAKIFSIFSLITLSTILFLIQGDHVIHHDSLILHSTQKEHLVMLQAQRSTLSTLNHNHNYKPIISMQEEKLDEVDYANQKVLVAPFNLNKEQRIAWFKENLQEFKILKSDKLAKQFHARIHKFLKNESCESQFFMTWISPSSSFGEREIFSIESLFKVQPQACLTILSRTLDSIHGYKILKPFLDKGFKVQAITPNLLFLFKGTLAESWFHELRKGKKDPGEIPLFQNLSNLIRLVVLYRYGGAIFNTVLIFDKNHPLLLRFINEFALTFDGNKWGHNGPYLVSRVVERLEKKHGLKFSILPPLAFYPADWNKISGFFKKPKARSEEKWVEAKLRQLSGKTYGVHLWNKQSSGLVIEEGSVIARLVSNHCVICKV
ncbi:lactosylceramide 4-alpha-galactosyltransferase [Trifolium repens]|nr:lactosylceramide 4-alpha-galactosyltransferase [Trifolium repens]